MSSARAHQGETVSGEHFNTYISALHMGGFSEPKAGYQEIYQDLNSYYSLSKGLIAVSPTDRSMSKMSTLFSLYRKTTYFIV